MDGARFLRWWTLAFVLGELVGFVPPALMGVWLGGSGASDAVLVLGLTLAGMLEGLAIGVAQASVLVRCGSGVSPRAWALATSIGAGVAWLAGMGGSAVAGASTTPAVLVLLIPVWVVGLMAMGFLQWRVLRRVVTRCGRWVPVSAGAWLIGVMFPVLAISLTPDEWPSWVHVTVAVIAAVAMGLVVGALTGRTMRSLLRRRGLFGGGSDR